MGSFDAYQEIMNPLFLHKQKLYFQRYVIPINKALRTFYALEKRFDKNLGNLGWLNAKKK